MNSRLLKPSELKSLLILTDSLHYKFKNFIGDGSFPKTVLLEGTDNRHEVVGKVVTSYNWGEFCLWPTLHHASLNPLLQMLSIDSEMTVFLCPATGKSLKQVVDEVSFVQHPKGFDRKKGYARDVLRGLEYLHQNSICLMNLTEESVLISCTSDKAVIGDFSCAICVMGDAKVKCSTLAVFHLPPEARTMEEIDGMPFDIWTCGVMFLQMYTRHVLPWCSLVIDLLDGLEIELLRRTNTSSYLMDDAATSLKEFLRPFLVFEPKQRISAEAAFASSYLQDTCNRLDEPAREFWKTCDASQFPPMTQLQNELPLRFSYLKGLPQGKPVLNKRLHHEEGEETQANTQDTGCIQIFTANKTNPNCISVSRELNEIADIVTSDASSDSSKNIGCSVFSSGSDGNIKLNVQNLQETHRQDRAFSSESFPKVNERQKKLTLLTSSDSNSERTVATHNVPFPNSIETDTTSNLEDLQLSEERPCRISEMSSSIEVITSVNPEESRPTLVLPYCDHKLNKSTCRSSEVPLPRKEDETNSEPRVSIRGGFLHNTWKPERKVNTTESAVTAIWGSDYLKDAEARHKFESIWPGSSHDESRRSPWIDAEDALSYSATKDIVESETPCWNSEGRDVGKLSTMGTEAASGKLSIGKVYPLSMVGRSCHSSWLTSAEEIARNAATTTEGHSKDNEKRTANKTLQPVEASTSQSGVIGVSMEKPLLSEDRAWKWWPEKSQPKSKNRWLRALCPGSKARRKSENKLSRKEEIMN